MRLLYKDKVIAVQKKEGNSPGYLVALDKSLVPPNLFTKGRDKVHIAEFIKWMSTRCMPEDRIGVEEELKKLGLERYDPYEIVKKTGAKLTGYDFYSVDFEQ